MTCQDLRNAVQSIASELKALLVDMDAGILPRNPRLSLRLRSLYEAASLALTLHDEQATDYDEDDDDLEPLGRLEMYSTEGRLMGMTTWRYTNSLDEVVAEPLRIATAGVADYVAIYMPNGSFAGRNNVVLRGSGAAITFEHIEMEEGWIVAFPHISLSHTLVCPQCGYQLKSCT